MNERIQQFEKQCWSHYVSGALIDGNLHFDTQKFAELIVRECCLQVADVRIENDFEPIGDAALVQALAGIKKYFGVEE